MPSTRPLIKGYIPLRVHLPTRLRGDDTFMFLKEHKSSIGGSSQQKKNASRTLFVSNVPLVPGVSTGLFLRALFGRYGAVESVSVVRNPRKGAGVVAGADVLEHHRDSVRAWEGIVRGSRWFGDSDGCDEGKFAHVTFASSKEFRDALRSLRGVTAVSRGKSGSNRRGNGDEEGSGTEEKQECVEFGTVEVQELIAESKSLRKTEAEALAKDGHVHGDADGLGGDDDDDDAASEESGKRSGVLLLADKYRSKVIPRDVLMAHCNSVMLCFEATEESDRKARAASSEPDEDGFVTVTYGSSVGSKRELEAGTSGHGSATEGRRSGSRRSRKKKESRGATELTDFYRFQRRETRKRGIQELRKRFEEDLAAVKKMKEEKMYRPF